MATRDEQKAMTLLEDAGYLPEDIGENEDEWTNISTGFGDEWDFEMDGALVGNYIGSMTADVPDKNSDVPGAMRTTMIHQFAPQNEPDRVVFVWGSYSIDAVFGTDANGNPNVHLGDRVRIVYRGKREIAGGKSVRQYTVQVSKRNIGYAD